MEDIQLKLNKEGKGAFVIEEGDELLAEMAISVSEKELTVYHTEVSPQLEGKGVAKMLLADMVDYARQHNLQVVPLCPFVHAQFKRHPEQYKDIWKREVI